MKFQPVEGSWSWARVRASQSLGPRAPSLSAATVPPSADVHVGDRTAQLQDFEAPERDATIDCVGFGVFKSRNPSFTETFVDWIAWLVRWLN